MTMIKLKGGSEMGILAAIFSRATMVPAQACGDCALYQQLQGRAVSVLDRTGFSTAGSLLTLENDKGFFNDVFRVFCDSMYSELRDSDSRAFLLSVASTSMLGGMYAYFCAKIMQKPLYGDYPEVLSRFKDYGPLPCVMRFIQHSFDHNSPEELSAVIDYVVDGIEDIDGCCDGERLRAVARVMYDTGMTMGTYFLH